MTETASRNGDRSNETKRPVTATWTSIRSAGQPGRFPRQCMVGSSKRPTRDEEYSKGDPMGRKAPYAFAATVATLLTTGALSAAIVESNHISFHDKAVPLNFDFTGQADLPLIKANSTLVGIESHWTFTPGSGQTGTMDLLANLYTPSFASGVDTKVGFSTSLDLAGGLQTADSSYAAQKG